MSHRYRRAAAAAVASNCAAACSGVLRDRSLDTGAPVPARVGVASSGLHRSVASPHFTSPGGLLGGARAAGRVFRRVIRRRVVGCPS